MEEWVSFGKSKVKGEIVIHVYAPKSVDGFFLIQTDQNFYSLVLGGYQLLSNAETTDYEKLNSFEFSGKKISKIFTDDYYLYVEGTEGDGVSYGLGSVGSGGEVSFTIHYLNKQELEELKKDVLNMFKEI